VGCEASKTEISSCNGFKCYVLPVRMTKDALLRTDRTTKTLERHDKVSDGKRNYTSYGHRAVSSCQVTADYRRLKLAVNTFCPHYSQHHIQ